MIDLEQELHDQAVGATGLSDFGPDDYRDGMRRFLAAVDEIPGVEGPELEKAVRVTVGLLVGRLCSQEGWRRRPACLAAPVAGPLVITGIPRTGTTLLHHLLSIDPRFQFVESWLIDRPKVRPPRTRWEDDPDFQAVAARSAMVPDAVKALHWADPDEADECLLLMAQSFVTNRFGSTMWVPAYDEWFLAQDMTPSFRRYADNLRLIGADDAAKPWLLKNPSHVLAMDELLRVFPGARVIHTHRTLIDTMTSLVSLAAQFITFDVSLMVDRQLSVWSEGMRRMQRARERQSDAFHDVYYADLVADPLRAVRTIYDRFDLELTPSTETAMRQWLGVHPQGRYGAHRYRPEDFGIDDRLIDAYFADYADRYAVRGGGLRG